jgi:predicted metalloprotease with PDZ domain
MMGAARMAGVAAILLLLGARAPAARPILYAVGLAGPHSLAVEMSFDGDRDGETVIDLPDHWAGSKELWRGISDFRVEGGTVTGQGATRTVRHSPGQPLVVRYTVASGAVAIEEGEKARPTVGPEGFFFHGEGVFATVDGRKAMPVRFRWGAFPAGWKLATDLEPMRRHPGRVEDLVESVGIGGADVQILSKSYGSAALTVAVRGKWTFTPQRFLDRIGRILTAEHDYWRERPHSFLVTLAPLPDQPGSTSYTGTGRYEAFSLLSTSNLDLDQATRVLAHEYDHRWVPQLLGGLPEQEEGRDYWFSEGFDDYLAARILLGSGLWSFSDYFANKNEVLSRYAASPARNATGADVAAKFWKDANFERVSYDRGQLLALLLDARIRAATHGRLSLDDVLRAQRQRARKTHLTGAALFVRTLKEVTKLDLAREIAAIVEDGGIVLLPADVIAPCARVETVRQHVFTRGFDIDATADAGMSIHGTDPAGPAYAAGLRDGMRLVRREAGRVGDSTQEIAYRVNDGGVEKVVRYMPQGREQIDVQRMIPTIGGPAAEAACRRLLGGKA